MNVIYIKRSITFSIVMIFIFVAWIPSVTSQFEMESRRGFSVLDTYTNDRKVSDDSTSTQCFDVYSWPLLDNTARVTAYSNDGYGALFHRIIRGLGVKGGECDEIDSITNMERIEVTFNTPQHLTFFEVRSLFSRGIIDPITEEGDIDLYLGDDLVEHYDIAGEYPYGIIGSVRVDIFPTILMDKIVFYVDENEGYSSYSEFTVAKIGIVNDDISFVFPFSGIDVAKNCLFQMDMSVLDGESDDSFDVFIDDMFVYQYIDEPPVNDSEEWKNHSIDLLLFIMPSSGVHTVRINATGEQWNGQPTYGQVAVDTIELYKANVTSRQGIRRLIYRRVDVSTLPLCCDTPVLCDSVDIGNPLSEAGHNLQEWGLIEPDTHGGYYGGIDDCRVTWQSAESFRWATVDLSCDVEKHNLVINVVGSGTTDPSPGTYSYTDGTIVELEAIPDLGWSFDRWDGDVADPNSIITNITMNDDEDVTAYFTEKQYTLNITVDGNGTVTKNPDKPYYFYNEFVNLTAVADIGWSFANWSGDLNGTKNPTTICMNDSKEVTATFIEGWYTITITINGSGTVAATPIGPYRYNDVVTLSPAPLIGWLFGSWSGPDADAIVDNKIIMTKDMEVTATFIEEWYTLNVTIVGNGTVDVDPIGPYRYDTDVKLTAVPEYGWSFNSWSGDLNDSNNPEIIVMNNNKDVTAHFTGECYILNITVDGNGTATKNPDKPYYFYNEFVNLTAVADIGWSFANWSGDLTTTDNPTNITMNSDKVVTATFDPIVYDLTILKDGNGTTTPAAGVHSYPWHDTATVSAVADSTWIFIEWTGDVPPGCEKDNPVDIFMDGDKTITAIFKEGWNAELTVEALISSNNIDWVVFGESAAASDDIDDMDLPKPGAPPAPYLYAYLVNDELAEPHNVLWEEIRYFTADERIWDLWVDTEGDGIRTLTVMTWNPITTSGYDYVELYELFGTTENLVADMTIDSTYQYYSDHEIDYHFQIRCTNNHPPVAMDDSYTTNENTQLIVAAPGVLWNDNDPEGDFIEVIEVISGPTNGSLDIFADGSFVYTPDVGFIGSDTFVYKITDDEYFDTATVTIDVIPLNRINIKERWNLISMPVGEDIDREDIIVEYLGVRYSWQDAIDDDLIEGDFTYGWQAGMYNNEELLVPGEGYWLWSYVDCDLLIPSSVPGDNHVTLLDVEWNLVGVPYGTDVSKTSLRVQYEGLWQQWDDAVDMGIILDFVYGWDRDNQYYSIFDDPDTFVSGFGYWIYAYEGCALKKV